MFGEEGIVLPIKNNKRSYLSRELFLLSLLSFCISIIFYLVISSLSIYVVEKYYNIRSRNSVLEEKYIKELQDYITLNDITIENIGMIDGWVLKKGNVFLGIFMNGNLIYDAMHGITEYENVYSEETDHYSGIKHYSLKLSDKDVQAIIFCYDYSMDAYAIYCSLILSFLVFFIILVNGIRRKISYLVILQNDLDKLSESLDLPITIQGHDEITHVAHGIDYLRLSIIDKLKKEKLAYDTNINLVTSLSHDIKTPLTSVIAYLELAIEKVNCNEELEKYIKISLEKSNHLKNLINELFDHFLLHSNNYEITFEQVNGNEFITQMLEENLFELEERGVKIKRNIKDVTSLLSININLLHRLFDNIFSNIYKYADLTKEIFVEYYLENDHLVVSIKNYKMKNPSKKTSANIGLNNCKAIMEKHSGKFHILETEETFSAIMYFVIIHADD